MCYYFFLFNHTKQFGDNRKRSKSNETSVSS